MTDAEEYMDEGGAGTAPYYPSGSNVHATNMVELTNPDHIILELELALKGLRKSQGKIVKIGRPLLNQEGVNSVISQTRTLVNQVTILSYLDRSEIGTLMMSFSDALIQDLMMNRLKYEIKGFVDRTKILTMTQNVCYTCLMRSFNGNDKNFWGKISMEINSMARGAEQNNSMLSKFNPFKK